MSFSFGNTAQPAQNTGGSLFGNASTNTAAKPAFSFGNTNTTSQPSTSLFGNANTQQQPQQQQQQQQGSTSLFGQPAQQQQGQQQTSSLFGNTSTQPQQPAQQTSLFGTPSAPQTQPATSGGLFGGNTTQSAGGSLFGNASTNQPAQGGGLFGNIGGNQQQQQQQQQQGGGLFGNASTSQPAGSSLFGSTAAKPGGLFGSTQNTGGGLFGGGNNAQAGQTQSLFGQSSTQPGGLGTQAPGQQQPQQQQALTQSRLFQSQAEPRNLFQNQPELGINQRIQKVKDSWDPSHPDCRFRYYFYNVVAPGTAGQYGGPSGGQLGELYKSAQRENPDPNSMVPTLATGWDDVRKRSNVQEQSAAMHQAMIRELIQSLQNISRDTSQSSTYRLQELQRRLTTLNQRLLKLAGQSLSLNPHFASTSLRSEELNMRRTLDNVRNELNGKGKVVSTGTPRSYGVPGDLGTPRKKNQSEGKLSGQVNELWGFVEEIKRRRKLGANGGGPGEAWLTDERAVEEVANILGQQQRALDKLREVVDENTLDVQTIENGLKTIGR